jgi:hypothetical protein
MSLISAGSISLDSTFKSDKPIGVGYKRGQNTTNNTERIEFIGYSPKTLKDCLSANIRKKTGIHNLLF